MTKHPISDAEYAAALTAGQAQPETELVALEVRYVPDRDAIELVLNHHAGFLIPRQWIGALQGVPIVDLVKLQLWPDGSAIELEEHDIHISVRGLMTAILLSVIPARIVAAISASRAVQSTSAAKGSSAQANGQDDRAEISVEMPATRDEPPTDAGALHNSAVLQLSTPVRSPAAEPDPDKISAEFSVEEIKAVLDAVGVRTREIYFAHRGGFSYAEIAEHLHISHRSVKRHIVRALVAIMEKMNPLPSQRPGGLVIRRRP